MLDKVGRKDINSSAQDLCLFHQHYLYLSRVHFQLLNHSSQAVAEDFYCTAIHNLGGSVKLCIWIQISLIFANKIPEHFELYWIFTALLSEHALLFIYWSWFSCHYFHTKYFHMFNHKSIYESFFLL